MKWEINRKLSDGLSADVGRKRKKEMKNKNETEIIARDVS